MPAKASYLVRDHAGRMSTVVAHSVRGALKLFLMKHRPPAGSFVSVKPRGEGDWSDFQITR